jgi:type IV pilus assembly protein PilY1
VNKLLTGGIDVGSNSTGYQSCGNDNTRYRKYVDDGIYSGTNQSGKTIYAYFDHKTNCTGKNTSGLELYYYVGATKTSLGTKSVVGDPPTGDGLIQRNLPKAQIGLAFYNEKGDGANITVPAKSAWGSSDWNTLKTPSQYNNEADQPLGDALFSIAGYFAQVPNSDSLVNTATLGACTTGDPSCGPDYGGNGSGFAPRGDSSDPFFQHGALSQCTKGNVIVLTDGEPCSDGNLPNILAHFADNTLFHCDGTTCPAAPGFSVSAGPPACISRSGVSQAGREKASLEDVALWAHTRDLRNDIPNTSSGKQALDIWIVRAFGFSSSNLLKYAAINGSFDDSAGTGQPAVGTYDLSQSYFESDDPYGIENALNGIFQQLLKRATSGTAASVLASGEGSGANLVQAVFYPQRIFVEDVIGWTGTLQNFWYYIDPFFGNSSIREDSVQDDVLNLVSDNTVTFYFDPDAGRTKANSYANDSTGNASGTPIVVPFEEVKSLWEAGKFLHTKTADSRTIFTVTGAYPKGIDSGSVFTTDNKTYFQSYLGVATGEEAVIDYVRGVDDLNNFRQRTVLYPNPTTGVLDNTVWKLGDIINSTPRVVASIPLNTYDKIYNDFTYKSFTDGATYKNRGMVFAGANDGMLHAFKLGKLEFPGDNTWSSPGAKDRARLRNLDASVPLGQEQWAFIPKNALPYLQALPDNNYCHLYYVDLAPQVFDASIGGAGDNATTRDASHWATVLIGGMRFGGACRDNTATCTDCVKSPVSGGGLSSYFAMNVTNPESPTVLWEFTDPALGFATTGPAIVRVNAGNLSTKGNWYAVFGSGPTGPISSRQFLGRSDQNLRLFIVDLKTGNLLRTIDTGITNAFAGSMINSTADFNLDYTDDVLYIGYVKLNAGIWNRGGVLRLQTKGSVNPNDWEASKVIDDIGPVTSSVVRLQNNIYNTNWLFFGSGRYYYSLTNEQDDPTAQKRLYGIKEPCFGIAAILPSCTTTVLESALTNVDTTFPAPDVANAPGFKGWYIPLDSSTTAIAYDNTGAQSYQAERVITDPLATTAGVVFFTTLRPYNADCAIGGRTFLWAVEYNTGGIPSAYALQGKALMQVSTASVEQLDLGTAFSKSVSGADASLHRGGRRSYAMEGVPPTAQGLSLLVPPPPVKRILHMKER